LVLPGLRDLREAVDRFQGIASSEPHNLEARRDVADACQKIGVVLGETGRRREALETDHKALAVYEELGRADPTSGENTGHIAAVRAHIASLERD
jgi:hypothetical protein